MKIRDLFKMWIFWVAVILVGVVNFLGQIAGKGASLPIFLGSMVGSFLLIFVLLSGFILLSNLIKRFKKKKKSLN